MSEGQIQTHHRERFSGGTVSVGGEIGGIGCVLGV